MGVFHVEQEDERDGATDKAEWVSESIGEGVVLAIRTGACEVAIQSSVQRIEIHRGASALGGLYRLDGVAMAAVGDEFILHENLVFPAAVAHGAPKRVLVLGGGDGGSVRRLLRIPAVGEIHVAEIDEAVVRAAESHLAPIHRGAFSDPRVHLHIADAAQVFDAQPDPEPFDLILFDLTDPIGSALPLYQPPFLERCRSHLTDRGILTLHTASPFYAPDQVRKILGGLRQEFPVVRPYFFPAPLYGGWWGMATAARWTDPATLTPADIDHRLNAWGVSDLDYYNGSIHVAQFALPNFIRRCLTPEP